MTMTNTRTALKRTTYTAIGIPVDIANRLKDKLDSTRASIEDLRGRLGQQTQAALDEWADEGERIIASISRNGASVAENARGRVDEITDRVENGATSARATARGVKAAATEPIVSLELIDGVGPAYAKRLKASGVVSPQALLARTQDGIDRFADQLDVSTGMIERWIADADLTRVDGIGSEFMDLLNAAGVGSITDLAARDADALRSEIVSLNADTGMGDALPSQSTLRSWISAAKKL
jgi:predicted flap endonuclease-1-like 5' DNA nuclease